MRPLHATPSCWLQSADMYACKFVMAEDHAKKFSPTDLVVVDMTNMYDEDNADALKDHAMGQVESTDAGALRAQDAQRRAGRGFC